MEILELQEIISRNEDSKHHVEELQRLYQSAGLIHADEVL